MEMLTIRRGPAVFDAIARILSKNPADLSSCQKTSLSSANAIQVGPRQPPLLDEKDTGKYRQIQPNAAKYR